MQEYNLFDFNRTMIIYGADWYKHNVSSIHICHIGVHAVLPQWSSRDRPSDMIK